MPRIKNPNRDCVAVLEDPRTARTQMYIYGDGVQKSSLSPVFNKHMKFSTSGDTVTNFSQSAVGQEGTHFTGNGKTLCLTKNPAFANWSTSTGDSNYTNLLAGNISSIDPNNTWTPAQYYSDSGAGTNMVLFNTFGGGPHTYDHSFWTNVDSSTELSELTMTGRHTGTAMGAPGHFNNSYLPHNIHVKMSTENYLSGIFQVWRGGNYGYSGGVYQNAGIMRVNYPNWTTTDIGTQRTYCFAQHIGVSSSDNRPLYIFTDMRNDRTHYIVRHNVDTNNETVLHTFNTAPSASGNNQGGDRDTATNLDQQHKGASLVHDDVLSSGNKAFYMPYFDTNNNYFPFYFQWNVSTDTFTRNEDVTITGTLSSTHLLDLKGYNGSTGSFNSLIYNEVHYIGTDKYITVFPLEGEYQANDAVTSGRTLVTYSIDATDPKDLTFHSAETADLTIKNVVWLNDTKTLMGLFHWGKFCIYSFSAANGWVKTSTIPYTLTGVGRDSTDRIFAVADEAGSYGTVHMITPTIPVTVVITPAATTYNYSGSNINSTIAVSAYGIDGTRIATTVNLTVAGSTIEFSGGATTTAVTTSASADTNVNITITGAGLSDILANIDI